MDFKIGIFSNSQQIIASTEKCLRSMVDFNFGLVAFRTLVELYLNRIYFDLILIDVNTVGGWEELKDINILYLSDTIICFLIDKHLIDYDQNVIGRHPLFILRRNLEIELIHIIVKKAEMIRKKSVSIKVEGTIQRLYYSEIMVIDPHGHYLCFTVLNQNEPIQARMKIKDIVDDLRSNNFVTAKDSTYVNCHFIKLIDKKKRIIILENGRHVDFSKRNYKAFVEKFLADRRYTG